MRAMRRATMTAAMVAAATLRITTGCGTLPPACPDLLLCEESSSGTLPGCVPNTSGMPVANDCGVFVSSSLGMDANMGTKSAPVQTVARAVEVSKTVGGKPIYACAEDFPGSVTLATGATIFGGLDCTKDWGYVGTTKKSGLVGEADKVALTIEQGANGTRIEDFTITGAATMTMGGSSVAVVVDGATAVLERCDLVAGDAMAGVAGDAYPTAAKAGGMGLPGGNACSATSILGGDPVSSNCTMVDSTSGNGGPGFVNSGGNGSDGQPGMTPNGGKGEGVSACTPGTAGQMGSAGMPGAGGTGIGAISKAGYSGTDGGSGTAAGPGQGGGGGGGAKGGTGASQCLAATAGGAAGGSGGSGGCGGAGGIAGTAGGSSIGLISLGAMLTLTSVAVTTGNGGAGGDGGPGQDGGNGGVQGAGGTAPAGLKPGCSGGPGGMGGKGGGGGGGQGGHSIGIAYRGSMPAVKDVTFPRQGALGAGGKGAAGAHDGAAGVQVDTQMFP